MHKRLEVHDLLAGRQKVVHALLSIVRLVRKVCYLYLRAAALEKVHQALKGRLDLRVGHDVRVEYYAHGASPELYILPLGQRHTGPLPAPHALKRHGAPVPAHEAVPLLHSLHDPQRDRGVLDALCLTGMYVEVDRRACRRLVLYWLAVVVPPWRVGPYLVGYELARGGVLRHDERRSPSLTLGETEPGQLR